MSARETEKTRLFEEHSLTKKDNVSIYLTGIGSDSMDSIHLSRAKDKWRVLVNIRWTFGFHKMRWISWIGEQPTSSHKELSSTEILGEILQSWINDLYQRHLKYVTKQTLYHLLLTIRHALLQRHVYDNKTISAAVVRWPASLQFDAHPPFQRKSILITVFCCRQH